jgi:hypothetical protein
VLALEFAALLPLDEGNFFTSPLVGEVDAEGGG